MKLNAISLVIGFLVASLCAANLARAEDHPTKPSMTVNSNEVALSLLFVQSARGLTYDEGKGNLTLTGISPVVTFFSDRPHRIAGHVLLPGFLQAWQEGSDSFQKDPPNADLSILEPSNVRSVTVELSNPRVSRDELTYKVNVLEGTLPPSAGVCSLFIDGLFYGAARGAAGGAIIGAACGNAGEGAAIGAAAGGVTEAARRRRALTYEAGRASAEVELPATVAVTPSPTTSPQPAPATAVMNVPNSNGSYTPVKLKQVPGGWQGPKGEIYPGFPTADELKKVYGL